MIPKHRIPTHPGEILLQEFLHPMALPQTALATHLHVSVQRINELIKGKRGITPDTAWLLAGAFRTSPEFWMNLQAQHDLAKSRPGETTTPIAGPATRSSGNVTGRAARGEKRLSVSRARGVRFPRERSKSGADIGAAARTQKARSPELPRSPYADRR